MFSQGSNDSNYSGPSSGGDLSYEENDKNHINKATGFNAAGAGGQGAHLNRNQQRNQAKTTQKEQKDAKQELELCRVIKILPLT